MYPKERWLHKLMIHKSFNHVNNKRESCLVYIILVINAYLIFESDYLKRAYHNNNDLVHKRKLSKNMNKVQLLYFDKLQVIIYEGIQDDEKHKGMNDCKNSEYRERITNTY